MISPETAGAGGVEVFLVKFDFIGFFVQFHNHVGRGSGCLAGTSETAGVEDDESIFFLFEIGTVGVSIDGDVCSASSGHVFQFL